MSNLTIRFATLSDAPLVAEAVHAAYAVYDGRGIDLPPVSEGPEQAISETPVLVATDGTDILGVLVLRMNDTALKVENLAVHPVATGRGLAKALLAEAESIARAQGIPTMRLATHRDLVENVSLYRHLGWSVSDRDKTKIMMHKTLPPG